MGSTSGSVLDERHLVDRARGGDRSAFRVIVETHQEQVYRLALALCRDHHDAEDVVQEVFTKAYRSLGSFRGEARLATWLHRIAFNASVSAARRRRARPTENLGDTGDRELVVIDQRPSGHPGRAAESRDIRAGVERALRCLSGAERTVFLLHHDGDMPLVEVARVTGRAAGTVRNLLFRAMRKLRRELADFATAGRGEVKS